MLDLLPKMPAAPAPEVLARALLEQQQADEAFEVSCRALCQRGFADMDDMARLCDAGRSA